MKRNVTITLDEESARWARIEAAKRDMSVSSFVGSILGEHMRREREYAAAMRRFLDAGPWALKEPGTRYPTRDSLHDR
jgi:ribosome biogenesis SPOUT family RNA methylase Rps3